MASTPSASTPSFPPLTTTFTPPPSCASLFLYNCEGVSCKAQAFPDQICGHNPLNDSNELGCYPNSEYQDAAPYSFARRSYSPGYVCPVGMTTAASAISPNGVWCCPTYVYFSVENFDVVYMANMVNAVD